MSVRIHDRGFGSQLSGSSLPISPNRRATHRGGRVSGIGAILFLFICLSGFAAQAVAEVPLQLGLTTRDEGKILANDLVFVPGTHPGQADFYPKAAVVKWGPISAKTSGRYRITMRARIEKFGASTLALEAWVPEENGGLPLGTLKGGPNIDDSRIVISRYISKGLESAYRPLSAIFEKPGEWQEITFEFDVEKGTPLMAGLLYFPASVSPVRMLELEKASLNLEKVDKPVFLSWARPKKLRYKHNEKGMLEVRICNAGTRREKVQLRPVVISEEDQHTIGKEVEFIVPAGGMINGSVPFGIPAADGGFEITGELLRNGKVVDRRGDVFAVTDSSFSFMLVGDTFIPYLMWHAFGLGLQGFTETVHDNWEEYVRICKVAIEMQRRDYTTYFEYFAWAREDASIMVEDSDKPYLTGQTQYPFSRQQIRMVNGLLKDHGIAVTGYANAQPFGWPGFEVTRRRPEWVRDQGLAFFNTEALENYYRMNDNPGRTIKHAGYPTVEMDYERESPIDGKNFLEFHIEQLAASVKAYGWEVFRYDAAPLLVKNFPQVKRHLAGLNPPVGIGNNQGVHCLGRQPNDAWKVYCKDASLMLEEDTNFAFHNAKDARRLWKDWIPYVRLGSHLSRSNGGHYTPMVSRLNWYASTLGYAAGGHPWPFAKSPFGDNERFMLRYGSVFWDLRTQMMPLAKANKAVKVKSDRPLWTEGFVSQRVLGKKRRQVIISVVNPPAEAEVTGTTFVAPADGVTVTFTPRKGENVTAWLLAPEPEARRERLAVAKLRGGDLQVVLPRFWVWSNVLFDCKATKGDYEKEFWAGADPDARAVDEPGGEKEFHDDRPIDVTVFNAGNVVEMPVGPGSNARDTGILVQEESAGAGWALMGDPLVKPGQGNVAFGSTYGLGPGKLRFTYRLKVSDNTIAEPVALVRVAIHGTELVPKTNRQAVIKGTEFERRGKYQEFSFEINKGEVGYVAWGVETTGRTQLWLDLFKVEQVSVFSAAQLSALLPIPIRPDKLALATDVLRVHETHGLFMEKWGVREAVDRLSAAGFSKAEWSQSYFNKQRVESRLSGFPGEWKDLYGQRVIVLNNVSAKAVSSTACMMLKQYVADGGCIVMMGDTHGLASAGRWTNNVLAPLLPIALEKQSGLPRIYSNPALVIKPGREIEFTGLDWQREPRTFYHYKATLQPKTTILLGTEIIPLAVEKRTGKGRVIVFLTSVMGEKKRGTEDLAFWEWKDWPKLMAQLLTR